MLRTPRRGLLPALALAVLLVALVPGAPAAPRCTPADAVCIEATSTATVTCTETATNFTCVLTATRGATATTATPVPGEAAADAEIEVGLCNGPGACAIHEVVQISGCAWAALAGGCSASDTYTTTLGGALSGCLTVWVQQVVTASVRAPNVPANAWAHGATVEQAYTSCP